MNVCLTGGCASLLIESFAPGKTLDAVKRHGITIFPAVPALFNAVLMSGRGAEDMASVRMLSPTQMEVIELKDNNVIVHAIYDLMPGGKRFARRGMALSVDGSSHEYQEFFDKQ